MSVRLLCAAALSLAIGGTALAQSAAPQPIDPKAQEKFVQKQFPIGKQWTALSLNGKAFSGAQRPTIQVDDQLRARGFSGCNTYSATAYPLSQQRFAVGPLAVTRMACDGGIMALERAFLVALRTTARWDLKDGNLVLLGPNGEIRFERGL